MQVGIADGPGLGRELARWMVHGANAVSVRAYDARRFGYIDRRDIARYGRIKGTEDHEYRHQTPLPGLERPAARPYRTTPLYERLHGKGAVFTQIYGWERPKWFPAAAGLPQRDAVSFRHTDWFDEVAAECRAVRERVAILDGTAFAKFDLIGPDAAAVLDRLGTNGVPAPGRIGLTYLLTPQGCVEGELTATRLAEDHLYLVSAAVGRGQGPGVLRDALARRRGRRTREPVAGSRRAQRHRPAGPSPAGAGHRRRPGQRGVRLAAGTAHHRGRRARRARPAGGLHRRAGLGAAHGSGRSRHGL